ncbi:hypothetical protein FEM48_Zijuj12G0141400 [Ziziphus jujuba var. spinosa]|uniref:Uncharacterized protein n=1 Tax=Ziziphus jujuba var. spinosa TaxID=714518 RepID=A0A978UDS6_ZIZJJ|nr:hypothetical protein FEM48_Zijuj12G0141400 [Ziziphus jujuba var. spinosa]
MKLMCCISSENSKLLVYKCLGNRRLHRRGVGSSMEEDLENFLQELENFLQEFAKKLKSKALCINGGTYWLVSSVAEGGKQRKEIFTLECQPLANGAREIVIRNFGMVQRAHCHGGNCKFMTICNMNLEYNVEIQCHRKLDPNIGYSRGKFLINWRARISSHLELRIRKFGLSQGNSL